MGRKRLPPGEARAVYFKIRMRETYRGWLAAFAEREGVSDSDLIERALAAYAKRRKVEPPPER